MSRSRPTVKRAVLLLLLVAVACERQRSSTAAQPTVAESALLLPTDPAALAAALGVHPDSLRSAGEQRYSRQSFDSARAILEAEVVRATRVLDSPAVARAQMWLGLAEWRLGDYVAARRDGEASLALKRRVGLDGELSRSFNALGLLSWNQGRHHEALRQFDSATVTARRHRDIAGIARATANIPLVLVELGDYEAARKNFGEAREAGRVVADAKIEGNALANLAMLEIRLGRPAKALPLLTEARRLYAAIDYTTGEANALGQLATAYGSMGDLQSAIASADSGLSIARAQGLKQEVAATLEVIADLHSQAGSPRLALRRLQEADSLDAILGLAVERGNNLRRMAAILMELGEGPAAVVRAERALAIHRSVQAQSEMVYDRLALAEALSASGNPVRAITQSDSALTDASRSENAAARRDAAVVSVKFALAAGDPRRAFRQLSSISAFETRGDWILADLRAAVLLALGRLDDARKEGERSITAVERERASLGIGPLRSGFLSSRAGPFSRMVAIHLARGDTAAAFRVAATIPGRSLTERLGGLAEAAEPISSAAEGERLLLRAAAIELALSDAGSGEQRATLGRRLTEIRSAYEELLAHRANNQGDRLLNLAPMTLREVQASLSSQDALLTFLSGPDRLDLFVVRSNSVLHRSVPIGDRALALRVRIARELLSGTAKSADVPSALSQMHGLLLEPAITAGALDGAGRLFIVPHGSLGALPFAALWNRRSRKFLVEERRLTYLPATSALTAGSTRAAISLNRLTAFVPLPDSLAGTLREANAIRRFVPSARVWFRGASTEVKVRRALRDGSSIHVASHGSHNSQNPLFSQIIVGQGGPSNTLNDGRLQVHEILGVRTTSPLVFLSGCETGLGAAGQDPFARGTDEGSLSQALLAAGVGTVVATLWRIDDSGAAELARRFYRSLGTGVSPEEALAAAQREMILARSSFAWAAYTVSGIGARKSATRVRGTGTDR